jgi:hypothetical protein
MHNQEIGEVIHSMIPIIMKFITLGIFIRETACPATYNDDVYVSGTIIEHVCLEHGGRSGSTMVPVIRIHGPSIYIINVVIKYACYKGLCVTKQTGNPLRLDYLTILNCLHYGLHVTGEYNDVDIVGAVIRYNVQYGILFDPRPGVIVRLNVIDSMICDNGDYGIWFPRGVIAVYRTHIINHSKHGICTPEQDTDIDIRESKICQSGDWAVYIYRPIRIFITITIFEYNGEF